MQLYILNPDYEIIGLIDEAEEVVWVKRYNDEGYCAIKTPCDDNLLALLKEDNYIYRYDDDMLCEIETVELDTEAEQGDYITVTANDICKTIFSGRIVWDKIVFSGLVKDFIYKVVNDNAINSTQGVRNISNLIIDTSDFSETDEIVSTLNGGEDVLQVLKTTCKTYNYGFRVSLNIESRQLVFRLYKGKNKATTENDEYVEFSPQFANILSSKYKSDKSNYKNFAVVGAKDSDESLMYITVYLGDTEPQGKERREIYVDATNQSRDIATDELLTIFPSAYLSGSTYYTNISGIAIAVATVNGDKVTVTDFAFEIMLKNIGLNALAERNKIQEFDGIVDTYDNYVYKTDYNLGDIVKVINDYGIEAAARVTEITESDDENGKDVIEPKFEYLT